MSACGQLGIFTRCLRRVDCSGHESADFLRQTSCHITSEFAFLSLVFLHQSPSLFFGHIFTSHLPNLLHYPKKYFFWTTSPIKTMFRRVSNVSSRNVCCAVDGKGYTVSDFLSPTYTHMVSVSAEVMEQIVAYPLRITVGCPKPLHKRRRESIAFDALNIPLSRRDPHYSIPILLWHLLLGKAC